MRFQTATMDRSSAFRSSVLSLAKTCSIGLRSGQEQQMGVRLSDCAADSRPLVAAKIVEHHDVAWSQCWHEELDDPGQETASIDRAVDDAGCLDPVAAQGGQEGHRGPTAMRHACDQPLASG